MFDPRQRMGRPMGQPGMPMQRPGWLNQLGQGLAAQPGGFGGGQPGAWPPPQGGQPMPPPGVNLAPQGGAVPPQAVGPEGRPMVAPGAGFLRDSDAAIRQALARRRGFAPVTQDGNSSAAPPQPAEAVEPDADQRGGPPDGDQDDPRARAAGMGGYR